MLDDDIAVQVLSNAAKQCLTAQFLDAQGITFNRYDNPDWEFPQDHPELTTDRSNFPPMRGYALRQFRAFKGHQEICRLATKPYTLVFEDDAFPNCDCADWVRVVNHAKRLLRSPYNYDVVSLHGRDLSRPFTKQTHMLGRAFVELSLRTVTANGQLYFLRPLRKTLPQFSNPLQMKWHIGCLAYLIGEEGRRKWVEATHGNGMPCDLFMVNMLHAVVCEPSPFDHKDDQVGSMIENWGPCRLPLHPDGTPKVMYG